VHSLGSAWDRLLATPTPEPKPKTYAKASGTKKDVFSKRERDVKLLDRLETFYNQGGPVAEAVDAYPLCILSPGFRLEGPEGDVARVQEVYDRVDIESVLWQLIVESLKIGDGIAEITMGKGGAAQEITGIFPRASKDFDIEHDDRGIITGYKQVVARNMFTTESVELSKEDVIHMALLPVAGSVYGLSLLQRAYDDIERDTSIAEATKEAIIRHGFRRFHVRVGAEKETVPQGDIDAVSDEFKKLSDGNKTEITTQHDVEILPLDQGALPANEYFVWTTDRLCTALGVPEEILGLGRGSTEATANVRRKAWNDKIGTFQKRVARCINFQLNDRITRKPGTVKLIFNDVDPEDESQIADLLAKLTSNSVDPFMIVSPQWCRERLGVEEDDYQEDIDTYDEQEAEDAIDATPDALKPFAVPGEQPNTEEQPEEIPPEVPDE
jgi:hypothetical protein